MLSKAFGSFIKVDYLDSFALYTHSSFGMIWGTGYLKGVSYIEICFLFWKTY